jgi:hypothetical protein
MLIRASESRPVSGPVQNKAIANIDNAKAYWKQVGCAGLFDKLNTWWFTLQVSWRHCVRCCSNTDSRTRFQLRRAQVLALSVPNWVLILFMTSNAKSLGFLNGLVATSLALDRDDVFV